MSVKLLLVVPTAFLVCLPSAAAAQSSDAIDNPPSATALAPVPTLPATISRTLDGAVTVRAVRIAEPLRLDGRLDERVYSDVLPMDGFIQQEPDEGEPATEQTEAWIFFDDDNLYVSARCWDSHPERMIADEMRRDSILITQNEHFIVIFDTFNDKRNGIFFQTNLLGAQRDTLVTDETDQNVDWNTVWDVKTGRFERGWTAEFVIPFKSLRYPPDRNQVWGVQFRRGIRWKNEWTYLTRVPAYLSRRGIIAVSLGATMVGLETPPTGLNLELKPYGISGIRTDRKANPAFNNKLDRNYGLDVKYGLTKGLTLDLTYRTDFAQVEDDTQQVNLTRFNQFYPERREFFLEGQGIFAFGGMGGGAGGGSGGGGGGNSDTPLLFFSRRIGLNNGRPVPIAGGGRLTGRVGDYSVGVLNIQSKEDRLSDSRATNFSVVRVKRNMFRRSNVGLLYTRRDETSGEPSPTGHTFGVDGLYSISTAFNITGYFARTPTEDVRRGDSSYLARLEYDEDRYGLQMERLMVGPEFKPEVGFLRRSDFVRNFASARFSPRPEKGRMLPVRRFVYSASLEYIENNEGRLDFREQDGLFEIEFLNSDTTRVRYTRDYEFVPDAFDIATGVAVPAGGYNYQNLLTSYSLGTQHLISGTISFQYGTLYSGTKRTLALGSGRIELTPQLALEPSMSVNRVSLPFGHFTTTVVTERTTYTITPRMFVSALTQFSSSNRTLSTNARFRWEYRPGSEMFVVYSDGRDTLPTGFPPVVNRAFIVKINKLFRL